MRTYEVTCYLGGIDTPGVLLWETEVSLKEDEGDGREIIIFSAGRKLGIKKDVIRDLYDKQNMDIKYVVNITEMTVEERTKRLLSEFIGVGVHTSLRKYTDSKEADIVWNAIHEMGDGEWEYVVGIVVTEIMKRFDISAK